MKYLTFDTSWLERMGYDFCFPAFKCLQYTDYRIVISEIVDREIKKHLKIKSAEFVNSINSSYRKAKFFGNCVKIPKELDEAKYQKLALDSYEDFKNTIRAVIIEANKCNLNKVIDDYFNEDGVFENKNKKKEFPDAIATSSIINYVGDNDLVVFSCDSDWTNIFRNKTKAKILCDKNDILSLIRTDDLVGESIDSYLDKIINEFEDYIQKNPESYFSNVDTLFPGEYCIDDLEIEELEIEFNGFEGIDILSKNNDSFAVTAAVHFSYSFKVRVSYSDTTYSTYDREDHKTYNLISKHSTISGQEVGYCFIDFTFKDNKFVNIISHDFSGVEYNYDSPSKYNAVEDNVSEDDYFDRNY